MSGVFTLNAASIIAALGYTPSANGTSPSWYDLVAGANAETLPSGMSFTRASSAYRLNSSGVYTSETTDTPRWQFDTAGAVRGLLVEGAATNGIRNSAASGASAGSPGTLPTNWLAAGTVNNVTRTVVGSGTEDGIPYVDIQFSGTPSASSTCYVQPEATGIIAALNGETFTASCFVRIVGGDLTNITNSRLYISMRDSGGTQLNSFAVSYTPTTAALKTQRYVNTSTMNDANSAYAYPFLYFAYTNGLAINVTLRIGFPNMVKAPHATSPIYTTSAAVSRAADVPLITNANALADQCWIIRARTAAYSPAASGLQTLFSVDDGTTANRRYIYRDPSNNLIFRVDSGGVQQAGITIGSVANDTDFILAVRSADNNFAASLNGGAIVTDLVGSHPLGATTARIGYLHNAATVAWQSTIRTIETRRTATDTELPLLAA